MPAEAVRALKGEETLWENGGRLGKGLASLLGGLGENHLTFTEMADLNQRYLSNTFLRGGKDSIREGVH